MRSTTLDGDEGKGDDVSPPAAPPPPPRYPNRKIYRNRVLGRFFGEYLILLSMSVLVLIVNMLLKRKEVHWWFSAPASKPLRSWLDLGGS